MTLADLNALELVAEIASGKCSAGDAVGASLQRIDLVDRDVQAWAHLDPEFVREQAAKRDAVRDAGAGLGPLHGVPVAVKDIFDTRAWPTENGTPLDHGRQPEEDCRVVQLLEEAGAVVIGKTVTTELATYFPGKTRNPHHPAHTPGGSSMGSAAAVASGMVPLAVGSQTNGSVIRPAAFCGVVGFKPTHGSISRIGVLLLSRALDHVGVFARTVDDVALISETLMAYDPADPDMHPASHANLAETAASEPPVAPTIAFVKTPVWDLADGTTQEAFAELTEALGERCDTVDLPPPFDGAVALHNAVMNADLAKHLERYYERGRDVLSDVLKGQIEGGQKVTAVDYNKALDWIEVLNAGLDKIFDRYDAILTPATVGEAPATLDNTGDASFCTLWSFCGTPAITLPQMEGPNGLQLSVQLVERRGDDLRLLRTANWLVRYIASEA